MVAHYESSMASTSSIFNSCSIADGAVSDGETMEVISTDFGDDVIVTENS